ncbi:ABC transporter permease [Breznakiella homolactica]|uniref:ABC transporter permease n=1 Tax=Breznakiella homolactica TaxID=2798577 RepID=A0A7T7XNJ9_9SPIR|nr:ABC transporter permease [Breznakiella homolactica]QQO09523.1 ABC transporter permease [Breznakiella homolactica]
MIAGLLTVAAPLILASLGGLLTELSGTLGVFIEGFMVLGSFFAWIIAGWTGSVFAGCCITAVCAGFVGWLLARFVHKTGANPFIAGLALNLTAGGLTDSLSIAWFGTKGVLRNPDLKIPEPVHIPLIEDIPFIGRLFSGQLPFAYIALAFTLAAALVIGKTRLGLRLKAAGLSPEAAIDQGIYPARYREGAWAAAAFLAALAGAALTFRVGAYAPGGVAGRGWIALAAVYLGFRNAWGCAAASLVFALAERIGFIAQGLHTIPATVLLGLPSALALVLFSVSQGFSARRGGGKKPPRE